MDIESIVAAAVSVVKAQRRFWCLEDDLVEALDPVIAFIQSKIDGDVLSIGAEACLDGYDFAETYIYLKLTTKANGHIKLYEMRIKDGVLSFVGGGEGDGGLAEAIAEFNKTLKPEEV